MWRCLNCETFNENETCFICGAKRYIPTTPVHVNSKPNTVRSEPVQNVEDDEWILHKPLSGDESKNEADGMTKVAIALLIIILVFCGYAFFS